MTRAIALWNRIWFTPVPVRRLALFRIVICAWAAIDLLTTARYIGQFAHVDPEFRSPIVLLRVLHFGPPSPGIYTAIHVALVIALLAALFGVFTRVALFVAVPLYLLFFGEFYSYYATEHGRVAVALALIALAIGPSGAAYSVDAWRRGWDEHRRDPLAGWSLRVVQVVVVAAYAVAGLTKLAVQQLRWPTDGALQDALAGKSTLLGQWLAQHNDLVVVLGFVTLALELSSVLAFLGGRWRDVVLGSTFLFHVSVVLTLDIWFMGLVACYFAFYDLEVGYDRVVTWVRARRGSMASTAPPHGDRLEELVDQPT